MSLVIIVMGVSGAGKSTVAQALGKALNFRYFDADDFHSDVNKTKMAKGHALTDADREPWLNSLASAINQWQREQQGAVLACSALRETYRKRLNAGHGLRAENKQEHPNRPEAAELVYLKATYDEIYRRMEQRQNHFMPGNAIVVDATRSLEEIVAQVLEELKS